MLFPSPLIKGKLIKRYKRFLADVSLPDGSTVTAHCPNTGAMTGCGDAGFEVWLSPANNPKRKLAYTWELSKNNQGDWIGVNTNNANKLVGEALVAGLIEELKDYQNIKPEVKYGEENSRIDFMLSADNLTDCFVEVKSVTLLEDGKGYFPDAKTQRGSKHLRELTALVKSGKRAVLLFCVQHTGIKNVRVADHIDPEYAATLQAAIDAGVQILAYDCKFSEEKVNLNQQVSFIP
ncbi:DNA/RNA nuclease SfsA [Aliiglaciecola lipolytica]|uniref:Sugar fermentation stimulation protein homolog n=1 Tax=Aliiglaciecola lipolytica E3 TaxID=1127673 RepID=K6XYC3_9ALTE|nr:DNA/RNA nuclease SfsA [Aliiglaciecola lipolytica]GAC16651.1 sugar fermentation stimulation protein A [Aliiglaciecola lipolytica E3]